MLAMVVAMLGLLALWLARRRKVPTDSTARIYRRFCAKLARAGVARRASEGPLDFAARVVAARPQLREPVESITGMYVALRYAGGHMPEGELKRAVRAFRPR
jgi:hypothetical protein